MSLCCMLGSYRAPSSLQPVWVEEAALCSVCGGPFSFFCQFETVPLHYVSILSSFSNSCFSALYHTNN